MESFGDCRSPKAYVLCMLSNPSTQTSQSISPNKVPQELKIFEKLGYESASFFSTSVVRHPDFLYHSQHEIPLICPDFSNSPVDRGYVTRVNQAKTLPVTDILWYCQGTESVVFIAACTSTGCTS